LRGSLEARREEYSRSFKSKSLKRLYVNMLESRLWYGFPEFEWVGHRWVETNFAPPPGVARVGYRDITFEAPAREERFVRGPTQVALHPSIGDRADADALAAAINAPLDPWQQTVLARASRGFGKTTLMNQAMEIACERGERVLFATNHGTIEVIADKRVGDERYLFTRDAVWKVEREDNVAQERLSAKLGVKKSPEIVKGQKPVVAKVDGQIIEIDTAGILDGDSVTIGGVRFVAQRDEVDEGRRCTNCRVDCTDRPVSVGWAPHGWFCSEDCSEEAKKKMQEHIEQHRTLAGKVDTVNRLVESGMLPTGSAAKRVYESLWKHSTKPIGESYQFPVEFPPEPKVDLPSLLERAWGIIANASGGDWDKATAEWREAASAWRDEYHRHDFEPEPIDLELYPGTHWSAKKLENSYAFVLESRSGDSIVVPFEMVAKFFEHVGEAKTTGACGGTERIGDQLRKCHCCDKEQKVDAFNLSVEPHKFVGPFGDAENMYVCDACSPDVLKAVRRVREGKAPARGEPHDIDLIAGDA
jgi:hypothetical protein